MDESETNAAMASAVRLDSGYTIIHVRVRTGVSAEQSALLFSNQVLRYWTTAGHWYVWCLIQMGQSSAKRPLSPMALTGPIPRWQETCWLLSGTRVE